MKEGFRKSTKTIFEKIIIKTAMIYISRKQNVVRTFVGQTLKNRQMALLTKPTAGRITNTHNRTAEFEIEEFNIEN